jgi:hypothetical protein
MKRMIMDEHYRSFSCKHVGDNSKREDEKKKRIRVSQTREVMRNKLEEHEPDRSLQAKPLDYGRDVICLHH